MLEENKIRKTEIDLKNDRKKYNLRNRTNENELVSSNSSLSNYSTVTDLAKFLG